MERQCCGYPVGIALVLWHSVALGIDYTMWISSAPTYFQSVLNATGTYGANATRVLVADANTGFGTAQSIWAAGQLAGCLASAPLPRLAGYRWALVLLAACSALGNCLYALAAVVGGSAGMWMVYVGRAVDGFGDGSVALGLSYIPVVLFGQGKKQLSAMLNYRALMALGSLVGVALCLPLPSLATAAPPTLPAGAIVGWTLAVLYIPSIVGAIVALDNSKPPVKKGGGGAGCTPYFTKKSCFWLFLVFCYGLTCSLATYFLPVFPYRPFHNDTSETLREGLVNYITLGVFAAGFVGAVLTSIASGVKTCTCNGLPLLRAALVVSTAAITLMYAGYRITDPVSALADSGEAVFVFGICLYFAGSTSMSAGMAPVYRDIIPKVSLSAMMPLYKICLDLGKVVGPIYSDWASASSSSEYTARADISFIPSIAMYALVFLCVLVFGRYLSTPDFSPESLKGGGTGGAANEALPDSAAEQGSGDRKEPLLVGTTSPRAIRARDRALSRPLDMLEYAGSAVIGEPMLVAPTAQELDQKGLGFAIQHMFGNDPDAE